jgi:hypothetical protein
LARLVFLQSPEAEAETEPQPKSILSEAEAGTEAEAEPKSILSETEAEATCPPTFRLRGQPSH